MTPLLSWLVILGLLGFSIVAAYVVTPAWCPNGCRRSRRVVGGRVRCVRCGYVEMLRWRP